MMRQLAIFIYRIIIQIYGLGIRFASFFSPKAGLWVSGRTHLFKELRTAFETENAPIIWMHCASLGEFEQGRPLIEQFKIGYPNYKILLTFFSPSGYEIRKNYPLADYVFYLPLDTPKNANQFLTIVQPALVFFIKYEFWYFYLNELQNRKIKHYLIAGVFRGNQFFFKKFAKWYLAVIQGFDYLFLQDEPSKKLLGLHGINNCEVAGDPRIDRVVAIASEPKSIPEIERFKANRNLLIIGSAHLKDLQIFFDVLSEISDKNDLKNWRFLIAPHEIDDRSIQQLETLSTRTTYRFSEKNRPISFNENAIFILDTIGQLSASYQYADAVFIGGGFDKSIHNILEPAVFGIPIAFGPKYHRFAEAVDLINTNGAFCVQSTTDWIFWFEQLQTVKNRTEIGALCKKYTWQNKGATKQIINYLNKKNILNSI